MSAGEVPFPVRNALESDHVASLTGESEQKIAMMEAASAWRG
jgi:hypothetical protein